MSKDNLRSITVGAKKEFASEQVEYGGETFTIRQFQRKERDNLLAHCTDANGQVKSSELLVWMTILCTYDPETGERVFDDTDFEAMMEGPPGDFVDVLGGKAIEVAGLGNQENPTED